MNRQQLGLLLRSFSSQFNGARTTHMERTAHNQRYSEMTPLRITQIKELSPTVKGFKMELVREGSQPPPSFLPGQWMDLYIPQIDKVGGYSMCSEPSKLEKEGIIDLAIKYSTWAPALWMHTKAQVNDEFQFRFGGDYHYPNKRIININEPHRLVLIAGGVGINPLASISLYVSDMKMTHVDTHLLYSARSEEELIFKKEFDALAASDPSFTVDYFTTKNGPRISSDDLERTTDSSRPTYFFICGPEGMIRGTNKSLLQQGIPKNNIFFELWT